MCSKNSFSDIILKQANNACEFYHEALYIICAFHNTQKDYFTDFSEGTGDI